MKKLVDIGIHFKDKLDDVNQNFSMFRDRVNNHVNNHKRNRKTLQHHMQLVELLEVPQLVDACARNGFYDEALELAHFVNGLERRHLLAAEVRSSDGKLRSGSSVVQSIVDEVHSTLRILRQQLLQHLTEQSSLPKELQILGILRKLDSILIDRQLELERRENENFSSMSDKNRELLKQHFIQVAETRLQMDFLEARSLWLNKLVERSKNGEVATFISQNLSGLSQPADIAVSTETSENISSKSNGLLGPYGRAMEVIEVHRSAWFSIITQFQSLFESSGETHHNSSEILGPWCTRQAHLLIIELKVLLPNIEEGASLRSVLEQALFIANRLGTVGCDFTSLLLPTFKDVLYSKISSDWKSAFANFKCMLATERFVIEVENIQREQVIPLYMTQDKSNVDDSLVQTPSRSRNTDDVKAPLSLMAYPPIAYLLNALLSSFNYLRECPLAIARDVIFSELSNILIESCDYFLSLSSEIRTKGSKYLSGNSHKDKVKVESSSSSSSSSGLGAIEGKSLDALYALALIQDLVPHILICFQYIYPDKNDLKKKVKEIVKMEKPIDMKEHLNEESYAILETCWKSLEKFICI